MSKEYDKAKAAGEKWAARQMASAQRQEVAKKKSYNAELRKRAFGQLDPSYVKSFSDPKEKAKMLLESGAITEKDYTKRTKDKKIGGGLSFNDWLAKNQEYRNDTPDLLQGRYADYKDDLQRRQQAAYNRFNRTPAQIAAAKEQFRMIAARKGLSPETTNLLMAEKKFY